jgi:lycopene beta-cyclase
LNEPSQYDYIVTGAGCAGLSLLVHMIIFGKLKDRKILLIDKDAKQSNDRTWCFWEQEKGLFEPIVYKQWKKLWFHAHGFSKELQISPYHYKLIRGIDFYNYCLEEIKKHPNITFLQAGVERIFSNEEGTGCVADGITYKSQFLFNSILFQKPILQQHQYWLLQHFKGWVIETNEPVFNASSGTLMDFRTDQSNGTTFFYVLPFSPNKALIEYTLFSKELLPQEAYTNALKTYIGQQLQITDYIVAEEEFGVIPMSNYSFSTVQNNIVNIGTAGGQTKASSGYTFRFIQKQAASITASLVQKGHPFDMQRHSRRFHFYDSILLHILQHNMLGGDAIFADLFEKNKPQQVLKFLDNETSLAEELGIISTLPTLPFLKAAIKQVKASV